MQTFVGTLLKETLQRNMRAKVAGASSSVPSPLLAMSSLKSWMGSQMLIGWFNNHILLLFVIFFVIMRTFFYKFHVRSAMRTDMTRKYV